MADMQLTVALLVVSAIVSVIVYAVSKSVKKALVVFSVLANVSFLVNVGSRMFTFYNLRWLFYFSIFLWPLINMFLVIRYFRKK